MSQVLRPYQEDAFNQVRDEMRKGKKRIILVAPTGCHAKGQGILMYDGSIKAIEDIQVGEQVMGWDSTPRTVQELHHGEDEMVRVTPIKGDSFVVNQHHILSVWGIDKRSQDRTGPKDISVIDWEASGSNFKWIHKLFRAAVEFGAPPISLPIEPYFMGVLIGDGSLNESVGVSKPDFEIHHELARQAQIWGLTLRSTDCGTSSTTFFSSGRIGGHGRNPLKNAVASMGLNVLSEYKFVPHAYKVSSKFNRLEMLAGLIDTDGSLQLTNYDFISKSPQLSRDICFLARSVGLSAYLTECRKGCQNGFVGTYWRVCISGDTDMIPCRIARKKAPPRKQIKSVLRTGFKTERIGIGEYFGFTIDGDGRYLMDDFTVTHNSGKTTIASHLMISAIKKGSHCLFLARREELIQQASERLREHGVPHGIIKAGYHLDTSKSVYVASIPTLANRFKNSNPELATWQPRADVIIPDEIHELTPQARKVIDRYPNAVVCGLSATPARTDGKGLGVHVGGIFESIVQVSSPKKLMEMGFLCPYRLFEAPLSFDFSGVKIIKGEFDQRQAAAVVDKPDLIGDVHSNWKHRADGHQTIIFAQSRQHGKHITEDFKSKGENVAYADAETPIQERAAIVKAFKSGKIMIVVNVGLYTQGFDAPNCSCVVLARATASLILYLQMVGRGFRPAPGKVLYILDHGFNARRPGFGLPDDDRVWSLDGKRKNKPVIPSLTTCPPPCGAVLRSTTRQCPNCGSVLISVADRADLPSVAAAELVERNLLDTPPLTKKAQAALALEEERKYIRKVTAEQVEKKYRFRFALTQFKNRFGSWPKKKHGVHIEWVSTAETIPGTDRLKMTIVAWELDGVRYAPEPVAVLI